MSARPSVSVYCTSEDKVVGTCALPAVFTAPIRNDIVQFVHTNMAKNSRQAYAVNRLSGMKHSAASWGTGRAVARIPRVKGSGTHAAAAGAFGNMCRKGRMFAPTRTWRKWHRKINTNQKRYAVCSAIAASALPALVMARGHTIDQIPEIPLVLATNTESLQKTRAAIAALKSVGAYADVEKSAASRAIRSGKGKMRNRRHVQRKGPLVVYANDNGIQQAFRNLPGVDVAHVDRLNLLQLAPGGHMGRLIVWTKAAFDQLNSVYGGVKRVSEQKKGYVLPRNIMANSDVTRLINSQEIQSIVRPKQTAVVRAQRKKNPLRNLGAKIKLNPYVLSMRRAELLTQQRRSADKANKVSKARKHGQVQQTKNFARIVADN